MRSISKERMQDFMANRGIRMPEEKSTDHPQPAQGMERLSIVVPVYNEQEVLPELHKRLSGVLEKTRLQYEIIYVNDGSSDATLSVIQAMKQEDKKIGVVDLSRNFGKEIALTAGLDHAD